MFVIGATQHSAFYTPPTTLTGLGSWTAGPDMPDATPGTPLSGPDTPAAVEVNGKVLCVGSPLNADYTSVGTFMEYGPSTNAYTIINGPPNDTEVSYVNRMLDLPNGQILVTDGYPNGWVYTPVSGPQASWAPTVSSVVGGGGGIYTVSGTQLNGLTNGAAYGDEANPYTHYPLVYLVDSAGNVDWCRTFNFSQMNPSTVGGSQSAQFTLPAGLPVGAYSLHVDASGVVSTAYSLTVGATGPTIRSFSPGKGPIGTEIRVLGTNLIDIDSVAFGSVDATLLSTNGAGTILKATVPAGTVTGKFTITTSGGQVSSATKFTVTDGPLITSFSPHKGPIGTQVIFNGANFANVSGIVFGAAAATTFSSNAGGTVLKALVPTGATTGLVKVTNPAGTAVATSDFTVNLAPLISSFSPHKGPVGTVITVDGANFGTVTAVEFAGGVDATSFSSNAAGTVESISVPSGAITGPFKITNPDGTTTAGSPFTVN